MKRLALVLFLSGLSIHSAVAANDLSHCIDPVTKLDAGGDVSDRELTTAGQACAHLQHSFLDEPSRLRIDHAAATISEEQQRREASSHRSIKGVQVMPLKEPSPTRLASRTT